MKRWSSTVPRSRWRSLLLLGLWGLCLSVSGVQVSTAALYEAGNNYNSYGHVYQDDVPVIGPMACCPTSAANSFNYLQNQFPAVYGSTLTSSPATTGDVQVIGGARYMDTGGVNGTTDALSVWGRYLYIESRKPFQTEYSCQVAIVNGQPVSYNQVIPWPDNRPIPQFLNNTPGAVSVPTWQFLHQNLQRGADVALDISYLEGGAVTGGHCLTVHRISFNDRNNNGIIDPGEGSISFVDPASRTEVTYNLRQNQDPGMLNGHPYLIVDYSGRTAFVELAVAEYPSPQAVPNTIDDGQHRGTAQQFPLRCSDIPGGRSVRRRSRDDLEQGHGTGKRRRHLRFRHQQSDPDGHHLRNGKPEQDGGGHPFSPGEQHLCRGHHSHRGDCQRRQ